MSARSLARLKAAASFVSDDVRGAVLRESGTTLYHPIQYNVNSESRQRFNSEESASLHVRHVDTVGLQVTPHICSFQKRLTLNFLAFTALAKVNRIVRCRTNYPLQIVSVRAVHNFENLAPCSMFEIQKL